MNSLDNLKNKLMQDPEWHKKDLAFDIGEAVIDARIAKGWTQEQLAEKSRIVMQTLLTLENGTGTASVRTIQKVSEALGVEIIKVIKQ